MATESHPNEEALEADVEQDSVVAIRALVAAERAVEGGRFNLAKVLRALAHSARLRAMQLERARPAGTPPGEWFTEVTANAPGNFAGKDVLNDVAATNTAIFKRAAASLAANRDVTETDVAQLIWGCQECGLLMENARAEVCPACGSFGGEFELFAPFFSGTTERLLRRQPDEILAGMKGDGDELAMLVTDVDDAILRQPAPDGGWCMKEIAGHMIDIAELYCRRLTAYITPDVDQPPERTPLPWRLLDGQDYPNKPAEEIVQRFRAALGEALSATEGLVRRDWGKKVDFVSGRVAVIDLGSWLVNHNTAHMEQIRALRDSSGR